MNHSVPFTIQVPDTQILPSTISQWEGYKSTTSVRNIAIKVCTGCHTILSEVIIPGLADAEIWRERAFKLVPEESMTKVWQMENEGESIESRRAWASILE